MKAAVLAECEHLARLGDYEVDESQQPLEVSVCKENGRYSYQIYCVGENIFIPKYHKSVSDQSWIKWYRLLGLEAKAKDAEIQRLKTHLANVAIEARRHEANSCWDFRDYVAGLAERVAPEVSEIDRLRAEVDRFKKASTEALESAKSLYGETPIYLLGIELVNSEALKGGQNG